MKLKSVIKNGTVVVLLNSGEVKEIIIKEMIVMKLNDAISLSFLSFDIFIL